jgi:hypothetical protein
MPKRTIKNIVDVKSLARGHTELAINVLSGIARSPKCPPAARVSACQVLLDRGWGKPDQVHAGADGGDIKVTIRQIIEVTGEIRPEPTVIMALPLDQDDEQPIVDRMIGEREH